MTDEAQEPEASLERLLALTVFRKLPKLSEVILGQVMLRAYKLRYLRHVEGWSLLRAMTRSVRDFYPRDLALTTTTSQQSEFGRNILGYPATAHIRKDGKEIGWSRAEYCIDGDCIPLLQVATDYQINIPNLIARHRPSMVVDFGTWCGALALLFYQLASEYNVPTVISVDISGQALEKYRIFHVKHQTDKYIRFLIGHSLSQTILDAITVAIEEHKRRRLGRILLSFDDDHTFPHTFHELIAYARLLGPGDVILMQDTWDQGLKPYPFSPMYSVFKFLSEDRQWTLDYEFLRNIELPCNFIHGVLIRRAPLQ